MRLRRRGTVALLALAVSLVWGISPSRPDTKPTGKPSATDKMTPRARGGKKPAPAEKSLDKIRQALEQPVDLEYQDKGLNQILEELHRRTGINFVLDTAGFQETAGADGDFDAPHPVHFKQIKLKSAFRLLLGQYQCGYAVLGDHVLISPASLVDQRVMKQLVSVHYHDVPLAEALRHLADQTRTNLVLDSRSVEEGKSLVTLDLEDVALDTAVQLMAEMAGLKSVRVGNVLFVSQAETVTAMRNELNPPAANPLGIGLGGLGGALGVQGGFGGAAGLGGLQGGGGLIGLAGAGGMGGALGAMGGAAQPAPSIKQASFDLVIPLNTTTAGPAKAATAGKPKEEKKAPAAQAKPAAKPEATPNPSAAASPTSEIRRKLAQMIVFDFESGPFRDALGFLSDRFAVPMVVDREAFQNDLGFQDVESTDIGLGIKTNGMRLRNVLDLLMNKVQGGYYLHDGVVVVTTKQQLQPAVQFARRVDAVFTDVPLREALRELADQVSVSIVLENSAAEQATAQVTATFDQVPVENAARVLAQMVGLKAVPVGSVLFVTTPAKADELREEDRLLRERMPPPEPAQIPDLSRK